MTELERRQNRALIIAIKALAFYGDPTTYVGIGFFPDNPCGDFIKDFSETPYRKKPGRRARKALESMGKFLKCT